MRKITVVTIILVVTLSGICIYEFSTPPKNDQEIQIVQETQALIPLSLQMIDNATEVLSKGYDNMSPAERKLFNDIFDPGDSGTIDQAYIDDVLRNYALLHQRLEKGLNINYARNSSNCRGMRLYYTNLIKIYVCPYFFEEDNLDRKALTLIHEAAHMELLVVDRYYFDPNSYSARYHALTPRGPFYTQIPLIGHIIREIQRSDTLYHPDTYAWFAGLVEANSHYSDLE